MACASGGEAGGGGDCCGARRCGGRGGGGGSWFAAAVAAVVVGESGAGLWRWVLCGGARMAALIPDVTILRPPRIARGGRRRRARRIWVGGAARAGRGREEDE